MLGVVVTEVQGPVVTDHVVRLRLERYQPPATLLLLLGLDGNVVQSYHGLGHGVVGRVHVHPETRETPVKVCREVVRVNVLAVEDAGREKMRSFGLHICLLFLLPASVLPNLLLASLLALLLLVAGVGTVRGLEVILLGLGGPGGQQLGYCEADWGSPVELRPTYILILIAIVRFMSTLNIA